MATSEVSKLTTITASTFQSQATFTQGTDKRLEKKRVV